MKILELLKEEKSSDLDAPSTTVEHRDILLRKPFLRKLYTQWYEAFLSVRKGLPEGKTLEIGSGGGFLKEIAPDVITSDILELEHCDLAAGAEDLPFSNGELNSIFMIDVLHHLPDSRAFFREASRTLATGGRVMMIEPATTTFSRMIYNHLHHEPFDPNTIDWGFPSTGPLSGANGALPWIIFQRDRHLFEREFPELAIHAIELHTPLRYLLTGGLSYKSLLPGWSFDAVTSIEHSLRGTYKHTAMFQTIQLEKK